MGSIHSPPRLQALCFSSRSTLAGLLSRVMAATPSLESPRERYRRVRIMQMPGRRSGMPDDLSQEVDLGVELDLATGFNTDYFRCLCHLCPPPFIISFYLLLTLI
jgi:hypothetical protein